MNVVGQIWSQIVARFLALPPGGRLGAGALAVGAVVALAMLGRGNLSGPNHPLLSGRAFSIDELTRIESAFARKNLSNYRVSEGRVHVPQAQQAQYLAALAEADALPSNIEDDLLKTEQQVSPWLTSQQLGESQRKATQAYLSRIIREMDGISKAYVLLDSKKPQGLKRENLTTASVSVESANGRPLDKQRIPQIRHLVAAAVAGLEPNHVTVVDLNGSTFSAAGGGSALDGQYLERMTAFQEYYRQAVLDVLSFVPEVHAVVNVELDARAPISGVADSREFPLVPPPKPGEPATENAMYRLDPAGPERLDHGLAPARITVAVRIPRTYYEQLWQQRHPAEAGQPARRASSEDVLALAGEENVKLRAAVGQVIPGCSDPAIAAERITVNLFERLASPGDVRGASPGGLSAYAGLIGLGSLVVAGGLVLVAWLWPKQPSGPPKLSVVDEGSSAVARAQLAQMVESDPQAAAKILRDWLGKAG